jgi:hypothetical protein
LSFGTKKLIQQAQDALGPIQGPEGRVIYAVTGYAGMSPASATGFMLLGAAGVVVVFLLITGWVFLPGGLPLLAARTYLVKPRIVAGTENDLAIFRPSRWTGKPKELLGRAAYSELKSAEPGVMAHVALLSGPVWLRPAED